MPTTPEVIEDGVVLIKDNRIEAVGKRGDVTIPDDAMQIATTGKPLFQGLLMRTRTARRAAMGVSLSKTGVGTRMCRSA